MRPWLTSAALLAVLSIPRVAHAEILHTRLHVFGMD